MLLHGFVPDLMYACRDFVSKISMTGIGLNLLPLLSLAMKSRHFRLWPLLPITGAVVVVMAMAVLSLRFVV